MILFLIFISNFKIAFANLSENVVKKYADYDSELVKIRAEIIALNDEMTELKQRFSGKNVQGQLTILNEQISDRKRMDSLTNEISQNDPVFKKWLKLYKRGETDKAQRIADRPHTSPYIAEYLKLVAMNLPVVEVIEKTLLDYKFSLKTQELLLIEKKLELEKKQSRQSEIEMGKKAPLNCGPSDLARLDRDPISEIYPRSNGPLVGVATKNQIGMTCASNTMSLLFTAAGPRNPVISSYDMAMTYYQSIRSQGGLDLSTGPSRSCDVFNLSMSKGPCFSPALDLESASEEVIHSVKTLLSFMSTSGHFSASSNEFKLVQRFVRDYLPSMFKEQIHSSNFLNFEPFSLHFFSGTGLENNPFLNERYLDLLFQGTSFDTVWNDLEQSLEEEEWSQINNPTTRKKLQQQYSQDLKRKSQIKGLAEKHLLSRMPVYQQFLRSIGPQCTFNEQDLNSYFDDSVSLLTLRLRVLPEFVSYLSLRSDPYETARSIVAPGCELKQNRLPPSHYRCNENLTHNKSIDEFKNIIISELLNGERAVGVDYCSGVLSNPNLDANRDLENCGNGLFGQSAHASAIIGVRGNPGGSGCQFLIQNSWGACKPDYSKKWECEDGKIWVDDIALFKNSGAINVISTH